MLPIALRTVSLLQYKRCTLYGLPRICYRAVITMFYLIMWQGAYKNPQTLLKLLSVLVLLVVSVFKSSGQRTECKVVTQCSTMSYHNRSMTTQK